MDAIERLEAAALKAREFEHTIGERTYTVRMPTRTEVRECLHEHGLLKGGGSPTAPLLFDTYLLRRAVVGWMGVRESDAVPGGDRAPLPWSERAVALVLEARTADADALSAALNARIAARDAAIAEDAKNSLPSSTEPGPTRAPQAGSA